MGKNNKAVKEEKKYQDLHELFEETSDYLSSLIEDHDRTKQDLRYLQEFIHYKKLDDEFRYFRKYAHEEYEEDMPFPYLTL